jgi:tetratricopeptide (TPR) repeat protein
MNNDDKLLQNLRDCTVRVHRADTRAIIGSGILVSISGQIITCSHVLRAAGIESTAEPPGEVGISFPQARDSEQIIFQASIVATPGSGPIQPVLLQMDAEQVPLAPEQIAVLGAVEQGEPRRVRSYGYAPEAEHGIAWIEGTLTPELLHLPAEHQDIELAGAPVLDIGRNLVVGIVCGTAGDAHDKQETRNYHVIDAQLLAEAPFELTLHDTPPPSRAAPQPHTDIEAAQALAALVTGTTLNDAPPPAMLVDRDELLHTLNTDWSDPYCRVVGLIGGSGEGTTSTARAWLDMLVQGQAPPDGVFWWSFHTNPNVDAFFEALLSHLSTRLVDAQQYPSSNARVQVLGAMLRAGRYLFVLDGLDSWQQTGSQQAGVLSSPDLREFLHYLAAPGHQSFCLLTSSLPLVDLLAFPGYRQRSLPPLSSATVELLLAETQPHPVSLRHLIDRLPEQLPANAQRLLALLSAFRLPVNEAVPIVLFRVRLSLRDRLFGKKLDALIAPLATMQDIDFQATLQRLCDQGLLQYDKQQRQYRMHAQVRTRAAAHLLEISTPEERQAFHLSLKDYYLASAGQMPRFASLYDLQPLIEATYHACRAAAYDEAYQIYWERIEQDKHRVLSQFGANETLLALMLQFFGPHGSSREPLLSEARTRHRVFDTVIACLLHLNRLREAVEFYNARNHLLRREDDWHSVSIGSRNLATLAVQIGRLDKAAQAAHMALEAAQYVENRQLEVAALAQQARVAHLRGDMATAGDTFGRAAQIQQQISPDKPVLYSQDQLWYAEHLWHVGDTDTARQMTQANLELCEQNGWANSLSQCHRLLGDLDAASEQYEQARQHYDAAVNIARRIAHRPTLTQALLARGRAAAQRHDTDAASSDLAEALDLAQTSDYRLYEADIRLALALLHRSSGNMPAARAEEQYVRHIRAATGYRLIERAV